MIRSVGGAVLPVCAGPPYRRSPHDIGGSAGSGCQAVELGACIWLLVLQQPGLDSSAWWSQSSKDRRASFNKRDPSESRHASCLLMSHWPKQVKWPTQLQDCREISFAFCGRICRCQEHEGRERKNLAILTIPHRAVMESPFMEILKKKINLLF